jgi:hypothetical protein
MTMLSPRERVLIRAAFEALEYLTTDPEGPAAALLIAGLRGVSAAEADVIGERERRRRKKVITTLRIALFGG